MTETKTTESECCVLPALLDKIDITKPIQNMQQLALPLIVNSFEELEPTYARDYKINNHRVWCIGPLSLSNKDHLDKVERGNKASIEESHHLKNCLDCQQRGTVIYAYLGSLYNLTPPAQLIELGLALESSKRSFIWVIRVGSQSEAQRIWINEDGFVERTNSRSLLIRGWAFSLANIITPCYWRIHKTLWLELFYFKSNMLWGANGCIATIWGSFFNEILVVQIL